MRFELTDRQVADAREYAEKSEAHTHNYVGGKGLGNKKLRIWRGKAAEYWAHDYCNAHGYECVADESYYDQNDKYDLEIHGYKVDIKCSISLDFVGQVTSKHDNDIDVDVYLFFLIDKTFRWIRPVGGATRHAFRKNAQCVNRGEFIPGTHFKQSLRYSYFLDRDYMSPFDVCLDAMKRIPKQEAA